MLNFAIFDDGKHHSKSYHDTFGYCSLWWHQTFPGRFDWLTTLPKYIPPINREWGSHREISDQGLDVLTAER